MKILQQTIETLEFPRVREHLARYTAFSASHSLALALLPTTDPFEARQRLCLTSEARRLLDTYPAATIGGAHDIRDFADRAARGGVLDPSHLLDIASTLISMRHMRGLLHKLNADTYPLLRDYAPSIPEFLTIENDIENTIDSNATVLDSASAALARLRKEVRIASSRLQDRLNHIVSSPQFAGALQEALVTVRNGRYVVPVKAPHRRAVPGLVHDQSASGATLYIEPMAVVELNNQLRELQLEEQQEVNRILAALSQQIGRVAEAIILGVETLAQIDLLFAQAKYAVTLKCVAPTLSTLPDEPTTMSDGREHGREHGKEAKAEADDEKAAFPLFLQEARHPLLDQQTIVPIDVWMGDDFRMLVITGPNTGGKTVALKTVGLLALMAQAGLHIPARSPSRIPMFAQVFADIGDEQSIEQSLSTFSSHMTTIIRMLRELEQVVAEEAHLPATHPQPSLVLLDEIGAGTDPAEGSALARAIIERLLERNCMGIVTTHYAELKVFAYNTPGVQNASVEFNSETLAPAYRLTIGLPGRSNALAIAARLGLEASLVERAQSSLSQETQHIEGLLEDIHHKNEAAEQELQRAEELRHDAEKYRERLARELRAFEESREEHMQDALREVEMELRGARSELRRLREQLRTEAQAPRQQHTVEQAEQQVQQVQQQIEQIARKQQQQQPSTAPQTTSVSARMRPIRVGDIVLVQTLGMSGEVVAIDAEGQTADVQVGGFRVHASLSDLYHKWQTEDDQTEEPAPTRSVSLPPAPDVPMRLDMRGWRASEVADQLERYLNDAYMSSLPEVHLIHGKGSGALRKTVREMLHQHPLVKSFQGGGEDGGDGVTVAKLVER